MPRLGPGPFTVFAPTNEAFAEIPPELLKHLLQPEHHADLVRVLTYHVTGSKILAADFVQGEQIPTLEGGRLFVILFNKAILINDAEVTAADNLASNGSLPMISPLPRCLSRRNAQLPGVVHIINQVLFPLGLRNALKA